MKKAGIFAAVIVLVLLLMQFYNYRIWAYMDDVCYVIDADQAAGHLLNGVGEGEDGNLSLTRYEASSPVYTRGKRYYISQNYDALDVSYPVYTNEGSYLYSLSQDMVLVNSEFLPVDAYAGIYVADGRSYNADRQLADPDEFLFLAVGHGLYMNVQELVIHSGARSYVIAANSLMNLTEEKIASYSFDQGQYIYGEYQDLLRASAEIGSVTLSYDELLKKLGRAVLASAEETVPAVIPEESTAEKTGETELTELELTSETGSIDREAEIETARESETDTDIKTKTETGEEENGTLAEESLAGREAAEPTHPPRPGRRTDISFGDSEAKKDDSENMGSSGNGGSGSGNGSGEDQFQKPEVKVSEFTFGVYHAQTELEIKDPGTLISRGIRIILYKKGEPRASYRKLFKTGGEITMEPLEPGTEYEAEGYFEYMDPVQGKVREYFLERQIVGKTLPIQALQPMNVSQKPEDREFYPHSVQITEFTISSEPEGGTATPVEAAGSYSAVSYLSSVQMSFHKKGTAGLGSPHSSLSSQLLGKLKKGEKIQWKTEDILESNSRYGYELTFFDRYGNALPLSKSSMADGETMTSKVPPEAVMTIDQESDVKELKCNLVIENKDNAVFEEDGHPVRPWLYITYTDQPEAPIMFRINGEAEEMSTYEIKNNRETVTFTSLLPSTAYTVWVKGSFELGDGRIHQDEVIGQILTTTDRLASLGTVNFQITADDITAGAAVAAIRTRTAVNQALFPFLSKIELAVEGENGQAAVYTLNKEELIGETMEPGTTYVLQQAGDPPSFRLPEIAIRLPKDSTAMTPWEAFFKNGSLTVTFPEGSLSSAMEYQVSARAFAVRGSNDGDRKVEEDVTGRYYQGSFHTLKKKAYVDYDMSFINGSSASFYNLRVIDGDGAVLNGKLTARLKRRNNGVVKEVRTYDLEELNGMEELTFRDLEEGTRYILEFVAQEYNEGYASVTKELQKVLYLEDGSSIDFTAENTLWGSLVLDQISKDYEQQKPEQGVGMSGRNLFDVNESQLYVQTTGPGEVENTSYSLSGYIPVEEGKAYILGGGSISNVYLYDRQKNYISSQYGDYSHTGIYVVPEGGAYIRYNVPVAQMAGFFMSEALFTEPASSANLARGKIIEGAYINSNGMSAVSSVNHGYVDYIQVEPGQRYCRLRSSRTAGNWTNHRVFFYDASQNFLSALDINYNGGIVTVPEQAHYVRMNLNLDSAGEVFFGKMSSLLYGEDVLAEAVWNNSLYVTDRNLYSAQTYPYQKYCDYIPVKGSATYWALNVRGIQVFDRDKHFLGYIGDNYFSFVVPDDGAYVRVNADFGETGAAKVSLRQITPQFEKTGLGVGLDLNLKDSDRSLGSHPEYSLEYTERTADGGSRSWVEHYEAQWTEDRSFETQVYFDAAPDCEYQIDLTVNLGGRKIVLDSAVFGTYKVAKIIKSEAGLKAVHKAPMEDYIVTRDLEVHYSNMIGQFYGNIDFQGHRVTARNVYNLFNNIHEGAEVKNLVLDSRIDNSSISISNLGALCADNRGTIRNIVLHTGLDNKRDNTGFGGLAYFNRGLIENFAIELQSDFYVLRYGSPGVGYNTGIMRNGYLVSDDAYRIKIYEDLTSDRTGRGGIVGWNQGGTIEQVYSAVVIEEKNTSSPVTGEYMGLITGHSRGTVRNVFGVGMTLTNGVPASIQGPAVGYVTGMGRHNNISYVETITFDTPRYGNRYNTQVTAASLWDSSWMDSAVNETGAFLTSMAADGFYPQLRMPVEMEGKQPLYRLPDQYKPAMPKILSVAVMEQMEDQALIKIGFENKNRLEIKDINLAVMNMKSNARTYIPDAADVEITGQELDDDGIYYVYASVSNPEYYRSQYYVYEYRAGLAGNDSTDTVYAESDREKTEIGIEFYQPVTTVDEWRDSFASNAIDTYGNYRIKARELDFSNIRPGDYQTKYRITSSFYGKIDGAFTDENGEEHHALLKNIHMDRSPCLINTLYGSVSNLMVDGFTADTEHVWNNSDSKGLVGNCYGGTLSGIHIRNAHVAGSFRTGTLVGYLADNATMRDCSASDSVVESFAAMNNVKTYIGGLVGTAYFSSIENSFAQNMDIRNLEASGSEGTGGLVGYMIGEMSSLINCFATGSIRSRYLRVGGLMGYASTSRGIFRGCYARVDLDVYGSYVGGLIGYQNGFETFSGNLSAGDIFVHSTSVDAAHRIAGYSSAAKYDQNYGFAGQMYLNSDRMQELDDAEELLTEDALMLEETYLKKLAWSGDAYAFSWDDGRSGIEQGYLPMLKGSDGSILPWQKPVKIGTGNAALSIDSFAINQQAVRQYQEMFPGQSPPFSQAFELKMNLRFDREQYEILSVSMEGMELNERMNETSTVTDIWQQNRLIRTYPFVTEQLGGDVYCLNVILRSKEDPDIQVKLSAAAKPLNPITMTIRNAAEWNQVMGEYGESYGNFVLTGDIDASTLPPGEELVDDVKINRLTSMGDQRYAIRGINHQIDGRSNALIRDCLSEIEKVDFKDIFWKVPENGKLSAYENIGLIGINQAIIHDVTFENIEITSGNAEKTGCIANNVGTVSDIELKDIRVSTDGSYAGGLAGVTSSTLQRIKASGTLKEAIPAAGGVYDTAYESTYEIKGYSRVGGIVGQGSACDQLEVTGIHVVGVRTNAVPFFIGGITGNGSVPTVGDGPSDSSARFSLISDSVIETPEDGKKAEYIGGMSGTGNIYYGRAENVIVRSATGMYTGGLSGNGYINNSEFKSVNREGSIVKWSEVLGEECVGGIVGNGYVYSSKVDRARIRALKAYAGGVAGDASNYVSLTTVDRAEVEAPVSAGGAAGKLSRGSGIHNCLVTRSKITSVYNTGGIVGEGLAATAFDYYQNGVVSSEIVSGKNADTGESNAGGIAGYLQAAGRVYRNYIKDTTVMADGDNAGGLVGASAGGYYYQNYTHGTVESKGSGAGGLIGRLTGIQNLITTKFARAQIYECYSAADVKGKENAAGLVGIYTCLPEDGLYSLTGEELHGILMMGTVKSETGNGSLLINVDPDRPDLSCNGSYMRIYGGAQLELNGTVYRGEQLYPDTWDSMKPAAAGGTAEKGNSGLEATLTVTGKNMMDKRLYTNLTEDGGMNWVAGSWVFDGLGRMDEEVEDTTGYRSTVDVLVTEEGVTKTIEAGNNILHKATPGVIPTAEIAEQGTYQWYRNYIPNTTGIVAINGAAGSKCELAGRGYYIGRVFTGTNYLYTPVIKVDTSGYMPYIEAGTSATRGGQQGIPSDVGENDSLRLYDENNRLCYGGIVIPEDHSGLTLAVTEDSLITVYPSGAGTVNVELGEEYMALDSLKVTAGNRVICETRPKQRVYTLNYDYQSDLTVLVTGGEENYSVNFDSSQLQRTVMVWGDDYYYTYDGTLRNSDGTVLDQPVLHLFGGQALTAEGEIYDAATGTKLRTLTMEPWKAADETIPVQQTEYEGSRINTYGTFSQVASASDALFEDHDNTKGTVQEQQLFVKNGNLYQIDGSGTLKGFVLDSYNGKTYMSALNGQQSLQDFADAMKTPEKFSRRSIAHMSDTLNTDQPYLLLRYTGGAARGFNYLTGEELPVENAVSDISLLDFAAGFLANLTGVPEDGNKSFADLRLLKENLTVHPISEEELAAANQALAVREEEHTGEKEYTGEEEHTGEEDAAGEEVNQTADGADGEVMDHEVTDSIAADSKVTDNGSESENKTEGVPGSVSDEVLSEAQIEASSEAQSEAQSKALSEATAGKAAAAEQDPKENVPAGDTKAENLPAPGSDRGALQQEAETAAKEVPTNTKTAYVYSFHTDTGTCDLYRQSELLTVSGQTPVSEKEKLDTLKAAGLIRDERIIQAETVKESKEKELLFFALTVAAALSLAGILMKRKRKS